MKTTTTKIGEWQWMGEIQFAPKEPNLSGMHVERMITSIPDPGRPNGLGHTGDSEKTDRTGAAGAKRPKPWKGSLPQVIDAKDFISTSLPPREEVISGVVHRCAIMSLGGESKMGKTWALLDMVISVATGTPFWNFDTTQGKVLYINMELPPHDLQKRLFEICKAKGVNLPATTVALWNLRGAANCDISTIIQEALDYFPTGTFSLIVVDPIYKCYKGRDENNAAQMTELLEELDQFAIKHNAVVAFAAHFAKGNASGKKAIDRVSGSGVFGRFPDTIVIATENKLPNRYSVELITRSFPEQASFVVKWDFPLMTVDEDANPDDLATANGPTLDRIGFIRLLAPAPLGGGEWKYKAHQAIGLKVNSFGTLRSEVVAKGWVKGSNKEGYTDVCMEEALPPVCTTIRLWLNAHLEAVHGVMAPEGTSNFTVLAILQDALDLDRS